MSVTSRGDGAAPGLCFCRSVGAPFRPVSGRPCPPSTPTPHRLGNRWPGAAVSHLLQLSLFSCRYLGDGRFHLESVMIANPGIAAYR